MIRELVRTLVKALGAAIFGAIVDRALTPRSSPTTHKVDGYARKQRYGLRGNSQYKTVHVKQHMRGSSTKA